MKIILVPTDFSDNSLHALRYAQELYKNVRAEFYLLHAYSDEVYEKSKNIDSKKRKTVEQEIGQEVEKKIGAIIESVIGVPPNPLHKFHAVASPDSLVDGVNEFVNEVNVDLIVMGTKGKTSHYKTTFGSLTIEVFKYVKCPVLAVPENFEYRQPKVILFPTDYMLPYKRRELKLLGDLAGKFKSEIHCLYISDFEVLSHRQEDNKLFLEETLSKAYLSFKTTPVKNRVETILEYIDQNNVGMLTMVNSRHSFFEDMLYRSSVDELGLTIKIPFLVMQNLPR